MSSHKLVEKVNLDFLKHGCVVEIGSARETAGEDSSTAYYEELCLKMDAQFFSVDFSVESQLQAKRIIGDRAYLSDGSKFLNSFQKITSRKISLLYLDNFDVIYNDKHKASLLDRVGTIYSDNNEILTNERSAEVHLEQMKIATSYMAKNNIVVLDDTMIKNNNWWGKGMLVVPFLISVGYKIGATSNDGVLLVSPGRL